MGAPDYDPFAAEEAAPLLPVEALRDMALCLNWMQHLRERAEGLMEEYENTRRELERLSTTPPILPE